MESFIQGSQMVSGNEDGAAELQKLMQKLRHGDVLGSSIQSAKTCSKQIALLPVFTLCLYPRAGDQQSCGL